MMPLGTCEQSNCKIAQGGACLEGMQLSGWNKCPHFLPSDNFSDGDDSSETLTSQGAPNSNDSLVSVDDEIEADDVDKNEKSAPRAIHVVMHSLSSGEELDAQGASHIMREAPTRLVIIAGDSDSGKSTLLSCLNERFQRGPYAGYLFSRSRTLVAFERICHESRLASKRNKPDTARTFLSDGPRFLHLAVRNENETTPHRNLLLSNISGEDFERVRNFKDEALKMNFIQQADHFALVIDGARIAQPQFRAKDRANAQLLLRRLLEAKILGQKSYVDILISKWDCLQDALRIDDSTPERAREEKKVLQEFLDDTEGLFLEAFEAQLSRLRFFNVAARPDASSSLSEGHGLETVFRSWVEEGALHHVLERAVDAKSEAASTLPTRGSSRFVWR